MPVRLTKRNKANEALKVAGEVLPTEAVAVLKKFKAPKFDQTVNVCMHLNLDPAHAEQSLRGAISLPKGIGKSKRVVAFCQGLLGRLDADPFDVRRRREARLLGEAPLEMPGAEPGDRGQVVDPEPRPWIEVDGLDDRAHDIASRLDRPQGNAEL